MQLPNPTTDSASSKIQELDLPAGKFVVLAKVNVLGPLADTMVRPIICKLIAGAAYDEVFFGANNAGAVATLTLVLDNRAGPVELRCSDQNQGAYTAVDTKLTAVQVANATNGAV